MTERDGDLEAYVRETARLAALNLQAHHLPGVVEHFARLAQQAEPLMAFPLDEALEPADIYFP